MSIIHNLKSIFRGSATDLSISSAYNKYSSAIEEHQSSLGQLEPYTIRNLNAASVGEYFTDIERNPEAYMDAHTDAMNDATSTFDAFTEAFVNFRALSGKKCDASEVFKCVLKLYQYHADAYSVTARYAEQASALSNLNAKQCEIELEMCEMAGWSGIDQSGSQSDLTAVQFFRRASERKTKADSDKTIANDLVSKVKDAGERTRASVAKASIAIRR